MEVLRLAVGAADAKGPQETIPASIWSRMEV